MIHQPEIWKSQADQGYTNTADFHGCSQAACSAAQPELPQLHLFKKPNTVHNTKKNIPPLVFMLKNISYLNSK